MKIIKLSAENIKKLKAVEIIPDGHVVKISGRNAQGKTTVLDSIWWALGGTKAIQDEPIRHGADRGTIQLELDDLIITRTFTAGNSYLKVENKQGAAYKSPQAVLDKLIGQLSFDPLAFARADAKTQRGLLLDVTGLTVDAGKLAEVAGAYVDGDTALDTINATYKKVFDDRTVINRELEKMTAAVAQMPVVESTERVAASAIIQQIQEAQQAHHAAKEAIREHDAQITQLAAWRDTLADLKARVHATERRIAEAEMDLMTWQVPTVPDLEALQDQLAHVEETNRQADAYAQRRALLEDILRTKTDSEAHTERLNAIKAYQQELVSAAQFPIDGLGFANGGVTYHGVPFDQASSAEKLQVSLAMAMALNPELRVIRVDDASLLDDAHMALIEAMARENDYQVWLEVVDASGKVGVYIEDGEVRQEVGVAQ